MRSLSLVLFVIVIFGSFQNGDGYMVRNNPYNRVETLDPEGKYQVEWLVDWNSKRVTFNVSVETKGFVAFGLASDGRISAVGDMVIGGVKSNGRAYFSDRYASGGQVPVIDQRQDWTLHSASESATHTFLRFSRAFDTCDPQDYRITNNRISLIWSYGDRDTEVNYIYSNKRGFFEVYLLDPDYTPKITRVPRLTGPPNVESGAGSDIKIWSIPRRERIPSAETSYICTMLKAPSLPRKHHVIGFETIFETEESRRHLHHMILYKCTAPSGQTARTLFEPFVGQQSPTCFMPQIPTGPLPTHFCSEVFAGYAVGGRAYFHPPQSGQPFGESPEEYYVFQTHYDNPNQLANINVNYRLELFYTNRLRPNDASFMTVGHDVPGLPPSLLIPPNTPRESIYGHCSGECTRRMLPRSGVSVYGYLLHSHNAGRQIRIHHFRNNRELPWAASDDNYSFSYQPIRAIREGLRVLPGDQLSINCVYDSTASNGTVVGGFGTRQEMCLAFILITRVREYTFCRSGVSSLEQRQRILGVGNVTWVEPQLQFVVDPPSPLQGLTIKDVSDSRVSWTRERRQELQRLHMSHLHVGSCTKEAHAWRNQPDDDFNGPTGYPQVIAYREPERRCSFRG